jgi:TP901 family phage tail tape measure protein
MSTRFGQFSRKMKKGLMGIKRMAGRVARGVKGLAISFGTMALVGGFALKGLFSPAARFEKSMAGINAVTLEAITNFEEIKRVAKHLGRTTIFTATEVGQAMEILARAGLQGPEILASIEPVLRAASAGGAGISETAKVVISTIKGFGELLEFKDAKRVADTFALVASSAKTTIIELGEGLSKVAPVAQQFGMRFEDVAAAVATLQDAGVEASMSGTQLKTMLTKLAMLTPKATKRFKQLGIEIGRGGGNMKTMPNLIAAIAKGLDKAGGNMQKVEAIASAVGLRGSTAANLLASAWKSGRLPELLQRIADKAGGAAEKMDELRQDTLLGDITKLKSAWEGFRIDIATGSLPELRDLVQSLTEFFTDPKNIEAAAKRVSDSVTNLKAFWDRNASEMKAIAAQSLKTAETMLEIVIMLAKFAGRFGALGEEINVSPLGRLFNTGPEWEAYYKTLEPDYRPNVYEVQGLTAGFTQDHKEYLKGEIVIRDDGNRVVGVSSSGSQVSLEIGDGSGDFNESTPYGVTAPQADY